MDQTFIQAVHFYLWMMVTIVVSFGAGAIILSYGVSRWHGVKSCLPILPAYCFGILRFTSIPAAIGTFLGFLTPITPM